MLGGGHHRTVHVVDYTASLSTAEDRSPLNHLHSRDSLPRSGRQIVAPEVLAKPDFMTVGIQLSAAETRHEVEPTPSLLLESPLWFAK